MKKRSPINLSEIPAVILAGGRGSRLRELTREVPKPLVRVQGKPLIRYIVDHYQNFGVQRFYVLAGYLGELIEEYFSKSNLEGVEVIFGGVDEETGDRLLALQDTIKSTFFLTYGDGISDVNIEHNFRLHKKTSAEVTVSAVQPPPRFGVLETFGEDVINFSEKSNFDNAWINGGFFTVEPSIFGKIRESGGGSLEFNTLPAIARQGKMKAYFHRGFWQPVDTLRDLERLDEAILSGEI